MSGLFLTFVNMSISASWLILAVLVLRLFLKKAPKWINVVLWGFVALRLIFPFSIESVMSLIPSAETITMAPDTHRPHFESGFTAVDEQVNSYLGDHYFEGVTRPTGHFVDVTTILGIIWIVGISAMLLYTLISFLRLKSKIGTAVLLRDNVFQSENVGSPFVLGIIKPKIYLPFNIGIQDMVHVIAHENAHIRRKDHLWKPLGFLILAIHWFNPLVWLGYVLLCRDIELACDEKVIKELDDEQKADYSQALLTCSVNRRAIAACPLAFGEVGVKKRVKSVLKYKKPALIIIIAAIIVSIIAAVCFLTNPKTTKKHNTTSSNIGGGTHETNSFESTVSWANWTDSSDIYIKALNTNKMDINSVHHLPIYRFDTLSDLAEFKNTFKNTLTMDQGYDEVPSFNEATKKYDEAFFEDNSLMLVYVSSGTCTHRFEVQSVGWDKKNFYVHIEETTKAQLVDAAMAGWFVTVAVSDETIKSCTNFDADLYNGIELYPNQNISSSFVADNGSITVSVNGSKVTIPNQDADAIVSIIKSLKFNDSICRCSPDFSVKFENGEVYGVKISEERYIRHNKKQAAISEKQADTIKKIAEKHNIKFNNLVSDRNKATHYDINGKKVAEVSYDSEGNKTYTYFYEDGSVAPARTYDISWYENGTYQYRRFYYRDDGKPVQVKIYGANESLIGYRMYSDKGELIEEKGFDSETGAENYCMKYKYKYRADGSVSEILFYDAREGNGVNGTYLETRFVNEEGKVYRATYYDGFSEEYSEPLIGAAIYYEQYETFYDEY